jgi:hypothetical protein
MRFEAGVVAPDLFEACLPIAQPRANESAQSSPSRSKTGAGIGARSHRQPAPQLIIDAGIRVGPRRIRHIVARRRECLAELVQLLSQLLVSPSKAQQVPV